MDISVEIPSNLVEVSNGRFTGKSDLGDGYTQWNWRVHDIGELRYKLGSAAERDGIDPGPTTSVQQFDQLLRPIVVSYPLPGAQTTATYTPNQITVSSTMDANRSTSQITVLAGTVGPYVRYLERHSLLRHDSCLRACRPADLRRHGLHQLRPSSRL